MAASRMPLTVHTEDGESVEVVADQRDFAAFEVANKMGTPTAMEVQPIRATRYVAYLAMCRVGLIPPATKGQPRPTFDEWSDQVVEVEAEDEDDEDDVAVPLDSSESGPPAVPDEG